MQGSNRKRDFSVTDLCRTKSSDSRWSADLRQRIFSTADDEEAMAGILIYTAAPDSEGTLGGRLKAPRRPQSESESTSVPSGISECTLVPTGTSRESLIATMERSLGDNGSALELVLALQHVPEERKALVLMIESALDTLKDRS
jgi:hypothetical protein